MASSKRTDAGRRSTCNPASLERRMKRYGHTNHRTPSTKETLINGDESELFDNSIKRLCSYLSYSDDDDDENEESKFDDNHKRKMMKKFKNFRRKSSTSSSMSINDNSNRRRSTLEMPIVQEFNEEKVYLPRGGERRLLPQEVFNIPPPQDSPETERRRCPPSLTLPRVPSEEAQYEEALPPPPTLATRSFKGAGNVVGSSSYGTTSNMETPIYLSQSCQYQYNEGDFDCTALQRNETGSFYIPSSGQTTMSTISPSRKSEIEQQQNRHNYFLASNANRRHHHTSEHSPVPPVLPMRPVEMSSVGDNNPRKFKRLHHITNKTSSNFRIPWRILTFALFICLIFALAVIAYLLVTILIDNNQTSQRHDRIGSGVLSSSSDIIVNRDGDASSLPVRPLPESFDVGDTVVVDLPPNALKRTYFNLQRDSYVQFNLSVDSGAKLAIFGRKTLPPSYTQYDFMQIIFGTKLHASPTKRDVSRSFSSRIMDQNLKSTSFDHYMLEGRWYLALLNDGFARSTVRFSAHLIDDENKECKYNCYEKGVCNEGKCHCFSGYTGVYCEETLCAVPCSGNGILHNGRCSCNQFWKGDECDVPSNVCEVPNCNGNGVCNMGGDCVCNEGFGGKFCEKRQCANANCSNHGVCVDGRCYCDFGWQGDSCDYAYTSNAICPSANVDQCSGRGVYDVSRLACTCDHGYEGVNCEKTVCVLDCGDRGKCVKHICVCEDGWTGDRCDSVSCPDSCKDHGQCQNGSCLCEIGWNGDLCLLEGCPRQCNNRGLCSKVTNSQWACVCNPDFIGSGCEIPLEFQCSDRIDNDQDGLIDCEDSECCSNPSCNDSSVCQTVPDPQQVLIRMQAPPQHSSFYEKVKFLLDAGSLQQYPIVTLFNQSRASVIRGRIVNSNGAPMMGVRIADAENALFGFTLSRSLGFFDLMVNGGGSVTLQFMRVPFVSTVRTFAVDWNQILYVGDIFMSEKDQTIGGNGNEASVLEDTCASIEKLHCIQPNIVTSWSFTSLGVDFNRTGVVADAQTVVDAVKIPGTGVHLTYSSAAASGHLSTLMIYLVPDRPPKQLRLVRTVIDVEGVRTERTFEARSNLTYTFGWDKRNVYKQKVFGLTFSAIRVEYFYAGCRRPFVEKRKIKLNGYRSSISDLGGWNLHIHHRYDVLNGILEKGDGSVTYMKEEPPILSTTLGAMGKRRHFNCNSVSCNDVAAKNSTLFSPVALASSKDGSLFIGDYNLIRKLSIDGKLSTVLELSPSDTSHQYYLSVHPLSLDLYISLPLRRQIWRMRSSALPNNYEIAVGTGESCMFGENCGDGAASEEAKLNYPKGIVFDSQGTLYIADERKIRTVSTNGFVSTLIGNGKHLEQGDKSNQNFDCKTHLSIENVKLQWPTSLAVNPVDDRLLVLDDDKVFEIISTTTVRLVAGAPSHCLTLSNPLNETVRPNVLKSSVAIASMSDGKLLVSETDARRLNRIRMFDVDGRASLLAGIDSACDCSKNCPCDDNASEFVLSSNARLFRPMSLAVDNLDVVHIADNGNFKVRSLRHAEPRFNPYFRHYEIFSPISYESYIFNRHGQHVATKNLITDRFTCNFTYHVDAPHGALVEVYGSGGHRLYIVRKDRRMITIENANGAKSIIFISQFDNLLQKFVGPDQKTSRFSYSNGVGLLISRSDSLNRRYFYDYDEFGRVKSATTPIGDIYRFETNVYKKFLFSTVTKNDRFFRKYSIKTNEIDFARPDADDRRMIFVQDSGAFHLSSSSGSSVQYDSGVNSLIEPYQTSVLRRKLTIPASKNLSRKELTSKLQWVYQMRDGGVHQREKHKRSVQVNGVNLLQIEYDRENNSDSLYNMNNAKFLTILYNGAGHIAHVRPTSTSLAPVNFTFDQSGRLAGVDFGSLNEFYKYDKSGRLIETKNVGNDARKVKKFSYVGDNRLPSYVELPSGAKYQLLYDEQQNLWRITSPSTMQHYFYRLSEFGMTMNYYYLNSSISPYVICKNDDDSVLFWRYPSGRRMATFVYVNEKLTKIINDGVQTNFIANMDSESLKLVECKSDLFSFERKTLLQTSLSAHVSELRVVDDDIRTDISFSYNFDDNLRVKQIQTSVDDSSLHSTPIDYETSTGRIARFGDYRFDVAQIGVVRIYNDDMITETTFASTSQRSSTKLSINNRLVCEINYSYDNRARLIGESHRLSTDEFEFSYQYNENGYLVLAKARKYQSHEWTYAYGLDSNLKFVDNFSINYDSFGRTTSVGHLSYVVDVDGFVARRGLENFAYDSFGRLVRAWQTNVYENFYFYDDLNRLIAFKRTSKWFHFYYGRLDKPNLITHMRSADMGVTVFFYDAADCLMAVERTGSQFYVVTGIDATVRYVFTSDTVIKSILRAPFGEIVQDTNANFFLPIGFKGHFQDPDNGVVVFLSGRPYDPISGRWMSVQIQDLFDVDVFEPQKIHVQTFFANDPVNQNFKIPNTVKEWSSLVGYDIDVIVPLVSPSFGPTFTCNDDHIITLASECVLRKKVEKFHSINSMELSTLSPKLERHRSSTSFTSSRKIFGDGVVISANLSSRSTIVRFDDSIDKLDLNLVSTLLTDSILLPIKFFIDDKLATFYFKKNSSQIVDDLAKLKFDTSSSSITPWLNVTVVNSTSPVVGRLAATDIQLNTKFSTVNIHYGGDSEVEIRKIMRSAMSYAENLFWHDDIFDSSLSKLNLTDFEMAELKAEGKLSRFESRFIVDPLKYSTFLASDPNNLKIFRRT